MLLNCPYFTCCPIFISKSGGSLVTFHSWFHNAFRKMIITWVARLLQNTERENIFTARLSLSDPSLSFVYLWPGPGEIQHPGQRRPLPESEQTKRFSFWAVKRRNATTFVSQVGALRLHIFICLTYLPSLAVIHTDSVQTSTHLENNRRRNDGELR